MKFRTTIAAFIPVLQGYVSLLLPLVAIFILLRFYEFIVVSFHHILPDGIIILFLIGIWSDIVFLLLFALLLLIPYAIIACYSEKTAKIFALSLFVLIVFCSLLLDQYFSVTFIPLGADLFGYSWSDIVLTVRSSGSFSLVSFLPLILFPSLTVIFTLFMKKISIDRYIAVGIIVLALLIVPFSSSVVPTVEDFPSELEYNLAVNKAYYFIQNSLLIFVTKGSSIEQPISKEFPLLHKRTYPDVLGPYFHLGNEKPNIVFLIIEGLGRTFVGENAKYGGFTPFLDSLSKVSLYWENFVSSTGRTFGVMPALFGSLPYGENGFMEMSYKMPSHLSLIKILNENGYYSSFYYGGNANFDHQDVFLERQKISFILDENNFGSRYSKSEADNRGFTWGYADGDLFRRSFELIDGEKKSPRLDIYLTLSTHEPFLPPHHDHYDSLFEHRLSRMPLVAQRRNDLRIYKPQFSSLLYIDDMLKVFFSTYSHRPDYANTIFIITGDHRIIPIPLEEMLDRFHVPFIIFSPMLDHPVRFSSLSSHMDVAPTLLALLKKHFSLTTPEEVSWIGDGIDTVQKFRNIHSLALMRNKNELIDYLYKDFYLAGAQLYRIQPDMHIVPEESGEMKQELTNRLAAFKNLNRYVCANDKIYPSTVKAVDTSDVAREDSLIRALHLEKMNSTQLFELARSKAVHRQFIDTRILCQHLLRDNPNFHDVRTLLGRTYAWETQYWNAEPIFREVLRRAPHYADAVIALVDIELWQSHYEVALELIAREEPFLHQNTELLFRKGKLLYLSGKKTEAREVFRSLRRIDPRNRELIEFQSRHSESS